MEFYDAKHPKGQIYINLNKETENNDIKLERKTIWIITISIKST